MRVTTPPGGELRNVGTRIYWSIDLQSIRNPQSAIRSPQLEGGNLKDRLALEDGICRNGVITALTEPANGEEQRRTQPRRSARPETRQGRPRINRRAILRAPD